MKKILFALLAVAFVIGAFAIYVNVTPKGENTKMSYASDCLCAEKNMIKSGLIGEEINFTEKDFKLTLGVEKLNDIVITSVPSESEGILKLGDLRLNAGDTVSKESIGSLVFSPASAMVRESSFDFSSGNYLGGSSMTCKILVLDNENKAPVINTESSRLSVTTQKNISIYGTMTNSDPENDETEYFIVSFPEKGALKLMSEYGDFKYTPNEGYIGKDTFSYIVRDCYGNFSNIATVSIKVEKNQIDLEYLDMKDCSAYHASLVLANRGIMLGELSGDGMYFNPNNSVSRADFVVMLMKAAGISNTANLTDTCFDDNDKIPKHVRPYIATAQQLGYINGSFDGNGLYFRPDDAITRAEAAVIISNVLNLSVETSSVQSCFSDTEEIPAWARSSVYAVYEHGLFERINPENMKIGAKEDMTRAQTAETLYEILTYVKNKI